MAVIPKILNSTSFIFRGIDGVYYTSLTDKSNKRLQKIANGRSFVVKYIYVFESGHPDVIAIAYNNNVTKVIFDLMDLPMYVTRTGWKVVMRDSHKE